MTEKKSSSKKRRYVPNCDCDEVNDYIERILKKKEPASKELIAQCKIIKEEFKSKKIEVNLELLDKYIRIGYLFFSEIFPWQKFATAICLCTFKKGTNEPRWNKALILMGRGNGKDGMIAWWSVCLTSVYHNILAYDIDIIANSITQSIRPIEDITFMIERKNKKNLLRRVADSIQSKKTSSMINARSSDATVQDGLRSGCVIFNEIHAFQNYQRMNVMISGLGKIDDPRTFYFTTNGEVRGGPLDDMLDTANDVLSGTKKDRGTLYLIYKIDDKKQVYEPKNWVMANPSLPYRRTLKTEIEDEFETWKEKPSSFPAFLQKRMNIPEMPTDTEVVSWDIIKKTNQKFNMEDLRGKSCIVGIDLSRTTDWTAINFLFYDETIDKFVCYNHAFVCDGNKDLQGIKAPWQEWVKSDLLTLLPHKEVDPQMIVDFIMNKCNEYDLNLIHVVIDDFKKALFYQLFEKEGFSKENENLSLVRPSDIARVLPLVERAFLNERLVWGDNPMLRWATNNTKVVPWKKSTTGDSNLGNQLYAKINPRFRKTDPFMAFVHSFTKSDELISSYSLESTLMFRGF